MIIASFIPKYYSKIGVLNKVENKKFTYNKENIRKFLRKSCEIKMKTVIVVENDENRWKYVERI